MSAKGKPFWVMEADRTEHTCSSVVLEDLWAPGFQLLVQLLDHLQTHHAGHGLTLRPW